MNASAEVKYESCDFCGCRRAMDIARAVNKSPRITVKKYEFNAASDTITAVLALKNTPEK